jgi:hypothetical protein
MSTSSLTKAATLSLSLASTRGKQISGATRYRKRRVWCDALVLRFAVKGLRPRARGPEVSEIATFTL